jgi:hypothetical protein
MKRYKIHNNVAILGYSYNPRALSYHLSIVQIAFIRTFLPFQKANQTRFSHVTFSVTLLAPQQSLLAPYPGTTTNAVQRSHYRTAKMRKR